jgi:hypothetical protein
MTEKLKISESMIWHPAGSAIKLASFEVPGMVYTGSGPTNLVHVISDELPVVPPDPQLPIPEKPDPRPTYNTLSAQQRGVYLNWLSGGRDDSKINIEYVLLFFRGLEWLYVEVENQREAKNEKSRL